jgi:glycosyltransferase involved in cell wall biosynthesis
MLAVCTTFPASTETFVRRDLESLAAAGVDVRVASLWGGGGMFHGKPVLRMAWWDWPALLWRVPLALARSARARAILRAWRARPPSSLNQLENLAGFAFGITLAARRPFPVDVVHAVWCGGPAAAGWVHAALTGVPFTTGAHAYDIFEGGGDWFLQQKLTAAAAVHCSSETAGRRAARTGARPGSVHVVRRSLPDLPAWRPPREGPLRPLRLVCIARLIPKKGHAAQLRILQALHAAGVAFEMRWLGDGPLRDELVFAVHEAGLEQCVGLAGHVPESEVRGHLAWADALLFTGITAPDGDRDGTPNAVLEAMASGVVVFTSRGEGVTEAVREGDTGFVAEVDQVDAWAAKLRVFAEAPEKVADVSRRARAWVERECSPSVVGPALAAVLREAAERR